MIQQNFVLRLYQSKILLKQEFQTNNNNNFLIYILNFTQYFLIDKVTVLYLLSACAKSGKNVSWLFKTC